MKPYRFEDLVPHGPRVAAPAPGELEERRRQLSPTGCTSTSRTRDSRACSARATASRRAPWIDKMWGTLRDTPSANWSGAALPAAFCRRWSICRPSASGCGLTSSSGRTSPSTSTPTRWISCSSSRSPPTETLIREIAYVHPDVSREMRAARYLNWRINRRVSLEDKTLIERVQAGMASSSYSSGPLSDGRGVPAQLSHDACAG